LVEIIFKACAFCSKSSPVGPPIATKSTMQSSKQMHDASTFKRDMKIHDISRGKQRAYKRYIV